jgi:hypothetical protein
MAIIHRGLGVGRGAVLFVAIFCGLRFLPAAHASQLPLAVHPEDNQFPFASGLIGSVGIDPIHVNMAPEERQWESAEITTEHEKFTPE